MKGPKQYQGDERKFHEAFSRDADYLRVNLSPFQNAHESPYSPRTARGVRLVLCDLGLIAATKSRGRTQWTWRITEAGRRALSGTHAFGQWGGLEGEQESAGRARRHLRGQRGAPSADVFTVTFDDEYLTTVPAETQSGAIRKVADERHLPASRLKARRL